jgi:hypothetical protein
MPLSPICSSSKYLQAVGQLSEPRAAARASAATIGGDHGRLLAVWRVEKVTRNGTGASST